MKSIIKLFLLALLIASSGMCFAQCDKTVVFKSSKTTFINEKGEVQRTRDEKAIITITKAEIEIAVNDDSKLSGTFKLEKCEWPTPFKVGKTVLKATMYDNADNEMHVAITITGVDGKVTLTFLADERPDNIIQVTADSFEEKKL